MDFTEFINQNVYIVSVVLFLIGLVLKQTPRIKDWAIPYILGGIGIIACNFIIGWGIDATLQGIIVTGMAVYVHQLGKQGIKRIQINASSSDTELNTKQ